MEEHMTQETRETLDEVSEATETEPLTADERDGDVPCDEAEPQAPERIEVEFSVDGIGEPQEADDVEETADQTEPTDAENEAPPADDAEPTPTVESVIEAILFASEEPLSDSRLAGIVETTTKQVRDCIQSLNDKYERNHNAFRIEQIAGGHQMLTLPTYNTWLKKMLKVRSDNKLSPAAMETLAIIAYKQPVIRVDIEAIRGVAVGEVIRSLMYKGLVKIVGRAEILGRPMLYGTTKKFLEVFGLNSLKDLPKAEELKKPD
jgi:segregation and condensation protein B